MGDAGLMRLLPVGVNSHVTESAAYFEVMEAPKPILLAEDAEDDLTLMRLAFNLARIRNRFIQVRDGLEALNYLEGTGKFANRDRYPLPCLIITDLTMPRMDGLELLQRLHKHRELASIPRIMLSASNEKIDRKRAGAFGVCAYIQKPSGIQRLVQLVKYLSVQWISGHCPSPR